MLWIDTPLVQETKDEWPAFQEMLRKLPGPLGKTTSVEKCGEEFVKGIEGRKRRINCPRFVGWLRWLKPLLSSRLGESSTLKHVRGTVAQNGRGGGRARASMSARTAALER